MEIKYKTMLVKTAILEWMQNNLFGKKTYSDLHKFLMETFVFPIDVKSCRYYHEGESWDVIFVDDNLEKVTFHVWVETKSITL